jgi:hypothetical protein
MKIALDLGHGCHPDTGADGRSYGGCLEEEIINEVGKNLIIHLRNLGHEVLEVRPSGVSSVDESLNYRTNTANNWGADVYVSIHANAGGGTGTEVFTFNGECTEKATGVLNQICSLGFRSRGIKDGSDLAVVANSNMESMLIEICFCDTPQDVALYRSKVDNIARAIATGVTGTNIMQVAPQPIVQPTTPVRPQFTPPKDFVFCEKYYLENNKDVRDAKINPYEHYITFGFIEGRKPSIDLPEGFSEGNYLYMNKDVDKCVSNGTCPNGRWHWKMFGYAENRKYKVDGQPQQGDLQALERAIAEEKAKLKAQINSILG